MIKPDNIKKDFPIFRHQPDLVYLDSGATSLKPQSVITALTAYYEEYSANIHRGLYRISEQATAAYEDSRKAVAAFIGAKPHEIIFTRNTTESLNLVAYTVGRERIDRGSEVVTTVMEHHSNFVPWQQLAFENDADFKVIDISDDGRLAITDTYGRIDQSALDQAISKKTKILAISYISNVLGTVNPVKQIAAAARSINPDIIIVVDAAQAVHHVPIDVRKLGCDFLAFSSHKMLGPTGVGVLWGREQLLEETYPFLYGGDMVDTVAINETTFKSPPQKFEAGTPHIAGVIALKEAISYIRQFSWEDIHKHEQVLLAYAMEQLKARFADRFRPVGPASLADRSGLISFELADCHPHDVAQLLDDKKIAVRAGHHCAMPLHTRLGLAATTRACFYLYNDLHDIDSLVDGLAYVSDTLAK